MSVLGRFRGSLQPFFWGFRLNLDDLVLDDPDQAALKQKNDLETIFGGKCSDFSAQINPLATSFGRSFPT